MKDQIKLVICDMDGTLLHDFDKQVPSDLPYVVEELAKRNVRFVCASGRQKASIENKIKDVKAPVICIGDNASVLYLDGEMVSACEVGKDILVKLYEISSKEKDLYPVVTNAEGCSYYQDEDPRVLKYMDEFFARYEHIDNILDVPGTIIKISYLDFIDPVNRGLKLFEEPTKGYNLMATGDAWIDVVRKEVSKGYGLQTLVDKLGLSMDNVAAFGDADNDLSMLKLAKHSFAMENATEQVKQVCRYSCGNCNDDAVTKKLKEIFEIA